MIPGKLYLGTSGLVLPVPNKLSFPPAFRDRSRLSYYASLFNSLEVNSSFYKVPMASTVMRWADSVPEEFRFTFKLWKGITHAKSLAFDPADVAHFMRVIDQAGNKKGCLLVQFPAGTRADCTGQLQALLETIRRHDPQEQWKVSVEFRHLSWYNEQTAGILRRNRMIVVSHDIPASAPSFLDDSPGWAYIRFHGPEKGYRGSYSDDALHKSAADISALLEKGKTVYVYFNNTLGEPIGNLATLRQFIDSGPPAG